MYTIIATCPESSKKILTQELSIVGADDIQSEFRALKAKISPENFYLAHYKLTSASSLLWEVKNFSAKTLEMIYSQVERIKWSEYFPVTKTFKIELFGDIQEKDTLGQDYKKILGDKLRQAISHSFNHTTKSTPVINLKNPDVILVAYLKNERMSICIKTSKVNDSSPNTMLKIAGYDGSQIFYDPMCATGIFAIEAAFISIDRSPLNSREVEDFNFRHLNIFDKNLFNKTKEQLKQSKKPYLRQAIFASDILEKNIQSTRHRAMKNRVEKFIASFPRDFLAPGVNTTVLDYCKQNTDVKKMLVSNLSQSNDQQKYDKDFFKALGKKLKNDFDQWQAWFLVDKKSEWKNIGLKPDERHEFKSGDMDLLFLKFSIYAFKQSLATTKKG